MRRDALLVIALLLVGCGGQQPPVDQKLQVVQRPNLLFITTDDQRFDMLGVVHPFLETPTMDLLAAEGVRFENAFVTTPICAASRASLLTGLFERTHQFTFGRPPLAARFADQSYPVLLREAGYDTGFVGKFGVALEPGTADRMFDTYIPLWAAPYLKEQEDGSTRHLTDIAADHAIDYLQSADSTRPFALTLSFNAPHAEDDDERQYIWPEAMNEMYADVAIAAPPLSEPAFFDALPEFLKDASMNRIRWFWRFDTPEKAQEMTKGYLRMITGVDAAIGRVLGELEALELASNTVVILRGDNGYFLRAFDPRAAHRVRPTCRARVSRSASLTARPEHRYCANPARSGRCRCSEHDAGHEPGADPRGRVTCRLEKRLLRRAPHGQPDDPQTRGRPR